MKKTLLFALSAALLLGSCKQTDTPTPDPVGEEISFKSEISTSSKVLNNNFEVGDQITVAALDGTSLLKDAIYSYNGTTFESSEPIVKESEAELYAYNAIYPSLSSYANEFNFEVSLDQSAEDAYQNSDLLVAAIGLTADIQPTLLFKHKLSSLIFSFKLSDGTVISPEKVSVAAKSVISCNIEDATYVASGSANTIIPAQTSDENIVVLAPQTIASGENFISFTHNNETYAVSFPADAIFESGYQYTYEFTVNSEDKTISIELIDSMIEEWEESTLFDPITPEIVDDFKAELAYVTETDIILTIDKGSWEGNYFVGLDPLSEYPGDPEEYALAFMDDEINFFETDLTIVDNKWVFFDSGDISLDPGNKIYAGKEYAIVVFGMYEFGNILTNIEYIEATAAMPEVAGSIAVEVKEVSYNRIIVEATPTPEVSTYIYGAIPTSIYEEEDINRDPEIVANAIIATYATYYIDLTEPDYEYVYQGVCDVDLSNLWSIDAETDYSIFVFAASEGLAICSDITVVEATTLEMPPVEYVDGYIEITNLSVNSEYSITYDATPTDDIPFFYTTVIPDIDLEQGFDNDIDLAAATAISDEIEYYGTDFSEPDDELIFQGAYTGLDLFDVWYIEPDMPYTMMTFGIDDRGNIVSRITVTNFTSAPSTVEYAPQRVERKRVTTKPAYQLNLTDYLYKN